MLQAITNQVMSALDTYQDRAARNAVSRLSPNIRAIFNKVAERKLVGFSENPKTFCEKTHTSDVAVLHNSNSNSSYIDIEFYVGGRASDGELTINDALCGLRDSIVKIQDVVSPILFTGNHLGTAYLKNLDSDFGKCIKALEKAGGLPLDSDFDKSFPLLEQVVNGAHPHFEVISKAEFDRREYSVAQIFITDIALQEDETLVVFGNGIGMDNWAKGIPLDRRHSSPNDSWELSIRGNKDMKYKIALLKPDGSVELENRKTTRKIKDALAGKYNNLSPVVFKEASSQEAWEMVEKT